MLSAALMLEHLGEQEAAARLKDGILRVYAEGRSTTRDVGGPAGTTQFTEAVIAAMDRVEAPV